MSISPACYPCVIGQALSAASRAGLDEAKTYELLELTLRDLPQVSRSQDVVVQHLVRRIAGWAIQLGGQAPGVDLFAADKRLSNKVAVDAAPSLREVIRGAEDPLAKAIQVSAAGNIIDFGAKGHAGLDVHEEVARLHEAKFARFDYAPLVEQLEKARTLLVVCDNAGEIVMDRLLLEVVAERWPSLEIVTALRGEPTLNDATLEDAQEAGLLEVSRAISSGSPYPGTILAETSAEFQELFGSADVVLAKGQGNFETLLPHAAAKLFFLLRIKCGTMAELAGVRAGSLVLMNEPQRLAR